MNEAAIRKTVCELNEAITAVPRSCQGKTPAAPQGVYHPHPTAKEPGLEESLDHLRLQIKYLLFDLEATRRENRYLRQMLESRPRPEEGEDRPGK